MKEINIKVSAIFITMHLNCVKQNFKNILWLLKDENFKFFKAYFSCQDYQFVSKKASQNREFKLLMAMRLMFNKLDQIDLNEFIFLKKSKPYFEAAAALGCKKFMIIMGCGYKLGTLKDFSRAQDYCKQVLEASKIFDKN